MSDKSDRTEQITEAIGRKASSQIVVGVSSCLLGYKVRYDGDHRLDQQIAEILDGNFTLLSVCPEVEAGMGVPREKVQLEGSLESPRMIGRDSQEDWTERMNHYCAKRIAQKDLQNLSGFILKARSPSCGIKKVKLFGESGAMRRIGTGLFAHALIRQFSDLPIIEDEHLANPELREKFIKQVLAYHRRQ